MKCHGDNKENGGTGKHSGLKHMLHMVLCCGLPIVIMLSLPLIAKLNPGAAGILAVIAPFICPLMMIGMIPMMLGGKKKGSCCDNSNRESNAKEIV
ncbi:hypothetical protein [Clostridium cochlearium]|uniref:hypothetical protein n=1 Tax=Clostridium cochlearium TaxID=1494 RepID=UPI000BBBD277|nr:hypothetical protein [Clostridium cochlearium]